MIKFTSFTQYQPGLLYSMLMECYASLPKLVDQDKESWREYDASVFSNMDTIGRCGFVSCWEEKPVGFASWDPRNYPDFVIIGHNCILPAYQNQGFGRLQVLEMLKRFKKKKFKKVKVSTGAVSFFLPAQKMYLSCDFREENRELHKQLPGFEIIHYLKEL